MLKILPYNTITGMQFPVPRSIILAALSEFRKSDLSDYELASHISECIGIVLSKKHFRITQKASLIEHPCEFFPLRFEEIDKSDVIPDTAL